jgi:hypothetical protein
MAGNRISAATSRLRSHLRDAIPDNGDLQMADGMVLDLVNAFSDGPDADVGEPEGRERARAGAADARLGMDRAAAPLGMRKLFAEFPAPRQANGVR